MSYSDEFEAIRTQTSQEGSFGKILKMRHKKLGYIRAIKELKNIEGLSERDKEKFAQECKTLLQLSSGNHPNIVTIYNVHMDEDPPYFEMAWIEGENFDDISAGKFMGMDEVYRFINDIGNALAFCHKGGVDDDGKGIVHNDLHPYNIIRSKVDNRYVLIDFGLAKESESQITGSLINTGAVEYISPERCDIQEKGASSDFAKEGAITPKWDIYSFGCLVFQALTGRPPFMSIQRLERYGIENGGLTQYQIWQAHKEKDPDSIIELRKKLYERLYHKSLPKEEECPEWLISMVNKCLAKEERYEDAHKFMTAFVSQHENEAKVSWRTYDKVKRQLKDKEKELSQAHESIDTLNVQLNQLKEDYEKNIISHQASINKKHTNLWIAATIAVILAVVTNCLTISVESKDTTDVIVTYLLSGIAAVILSILVYSELQLDKSK